MTRTDVNRMYWREWRSHQHEPVILTQAPGLFHQIPGSLEAVYPQGLVIHLAHYRIWIAFIDLYCGHAAVSVPHQQWA
jgi:hypothetical protein